MYYYYIIYIYFNVQIYTFTFMHLADTFIQRNLQCIQAIHYVCSREFNPQPFALLTQCSTPEPQEHPIYIFNKKCWGRGLLAWSDFLFFCL